MTNPGNHLPVDLYGRLIPAIIREDIKTGVYSNITFWDDPLFVWDEGKFWDEIGLLPVIKNLYYGIEQEETHDEMEISKLTDLIDPDRCPLKFLRNLSESFGYPLDTSKPEIEQREIVKSIVALNKTRGTPISWTAFYRTLGIKVNPIPLYKKNIHESNNQYSRHRYTTEKITKEVLATMGSAEYTGFFAKLPIKPGSVFVYSSDYSLRDIGNSLDEKYGSLLGQNCSGKINYATGKFSLSFTSATTEDVKTDYEHITDEFPYSAARIDLDVYFAAHEDSSEFLTTKLLDKIIAMAEEVRPIHVLLRLVVLALLPEDIVNDFATDSVSCGQLIAMDPRDDNYRAYPVDGVPLNQDEILILTKNNEEKIAILDDNCLINTYFPETLKIRIGEEIQYW
jgi:hypothetical protein